VEPFERLGRVGRANHLQRAAETAFPGNVAFHFPRGVVGVRVVGIRVVGVRVVGLGAVRAVGWLAVALLELEAAQ
jgi:hypothetical protein